MSVAVLREAEDRVDELQLARPAAYTLARVLAPAARIERTLLRRARLELTDADASAEADLWLCGLVSSQTPQGIVLEREAAAILRARLAADRVTFERACALIAWEHRDAPWPVRVEERIYQLTAAQDAQVEDAEAVLVAAARRMLESTDRRAVGAWVLRTLMRLPPGLDRSPVTQALGAGVRVQVDGRLELPEDVPPDTMDNWLPWLLAGAVDTAAIGVTFGDDGLNFHAGGGQSAGAIHVPATSPLVLDLRWHDGREVHVQRVSLKADQSARIPVAASEVEVRGINGSRYRLRRPGTRRATAGFDYTHIRARHRPFIGREGELQEIDDALRERPAVGIVGPDGLGKTALACRYIDILEARGEEVVYHFVGGGPKSWEDAATIEASLLAQLRGRGSTRAPQPHVDFLDQLSPLLGERPLFMVLDALGTRQLDELIVPWTRSRLPPQLRVLYTGEFSLNLLEGQHVIALGERREANAALCRRYLEAHRPVLQQQGIASGSRAFLVSAAADWALAGQIRGALRQLGYDVLVDDSQRLVAGRPWLEEIGRAIGRSDFGIVLATPAAAESDLVRQEIELMVSAGKEIVPIDSGDRVFGRGALRQLATLQFVQLTRGGEVDSVLRTALAARVFRQDAIEGLLARADSYIGRLVRMLEWIRRQNGPVSLERIPPTLYDGFDEAWARVTGMGDLPLEAVLGMLAAAPVPLPLTWLSVSLNTTQQTVSAALDRLAAEGITVTSLLPREVEDDKGNVTGRFVGAHAALADESLRDAVAARIPRDVLRSAHLRLAAYPDEDYRLRYRLRHLADAGQTAAAREQALDMGWLSRVCAVCGPDLLIEQLAHMRDALDGLLVRDEIQPSTDQDPLPRLLRTIRAERELLRTHAADFTSIVGNRLAEAGVSWQEIDSVYLTRSLPLLRHAAALALVKDPVSSVQELDFTTCAARWDEVVAGTEDGRLCAWTQPTRALGAPDAILAAHQGRVSFLAFAAGHELLLSGGTDGVVHVWGAVLDASSSPRETYDDRSAAIKFVLYPAGLHRIMAGAEDGVIRVWREGINDPDLQLIGHGAAITALAVTHNGRTLISASRDGTVRRWDLESGRCLATGHSHTAPVIGCALVENVPGQDARVLSASEDGRVMLWTLDLEPYATLGAHHGPVRDLQYVPPPEGPYAVTAGDDGTVRVWDVAGAREERVFMAHRSAVAAVRPYGISPRLAFSLAVDGTCGSIDLDTGRTLSDLRIAGGGQARVSLSPSGNLAACATAGGTLTRIDLTAPSNAGRFHVALDRSGQFIVVGAGKGIAIGNWASGQLEWTSSPDHLGIVALTMEQDGDAFLTSHEDGWIRRWTVDGRMEGIQQVNTAPVALAVGWDADRAFLAYGDGTIEEKVGIRHGPVLGRIITTIPPGVSACAIDSADRLLLACIDGTLALWDLEADRLLTRIDAHARTLLDCDIWRDGERLLAASEDGGLSLWGSDGTLWHRFVGHEDAVTGCRFGARPDRIVSCSRDGSIKLWDAKSGQCLETYYAQAPLVALAAAAFGDVVAAVEETGRVIILQSTELASGRPAA